MALSRAERDVGMHLTREVLLEPAFEEEGIASGLVSSKDQHNSGPLAAKATITSWQDQPALPRRASYVTLMTSTPYLHRSHTHVNKQLEKASVDT